MTWEYPHLTSTLLPVREEGGLEYNPISEENCCELIKSPLLNSSKFVTSATDLGIKLFHSCTMLIAKESLNGLHGAHLRIQSCNLRL